MYTLVESIKYKQEYSKQIWKVKVTNIHTFLCRHYQLFVYLFALETAMVNDDDQVTREVPTDGSDEWSDYYLNLF
jgi:hypothetical protein